MSAALDRLKQQNGPVQSPQPLGSPETMELLTSVLAAVEAQNTRIATLTEQQKKLAGFVKVMDEETTRRLERITAPASTSSPSSDVSARIASIESRQNEIASTLAEFAQSLNGESLNAASRSLVAEAQKNRAATASAIEGLKAQATANQKLVSQVGGAVQRIEKRTEERVEKAVKQVAGEASATMTANLDASNERAERIIAATAKLEARQLWSAAAAMCLALLPVTVVVAGLWMGIAGLSQALSGPSTWTGACGSGSVAGSWSPWASPGPATDSSRPSAGSPVSWRPGRAAGCRGGPVGGDGWIRSSYRFRSAVEGFSQQPVLRPRCRRRSLTSIPAVTAIATAIPAPMIQGLPRSPPTPASAPPAAMSGRPQQSSNGSAQHASRSSPVPAATMGPARRSSRS